MFLGLDGYMHCPQLPRVQEVRVAMKTPSEAVEVVVRNSGARPPRGRCSPGAHRRRRAEPLRTRPSSLADVLAHGPWFSLLSPTLARRVVADAYLTRHPAYDVVARCHERVHSWIGVADGAVALLRLLSSGRVMRFAEVFQGGWTDEAPGPGCDVRAYDIVAVRPCCVVHIPGDTVATLLECSTALNHFMIERLYQRLGQFMQTIEADRMADPLVCVARAIARLYDPLLNPGAPSELQLPQEDLAELSGLTRQRANAAVKTLERRGVLTVRYGGVVVTDLAELRRVADGSSDRPPAV